MRRRPQEMVGALRRLRRVEHDQRRGPPVCRPRQGRAGGRQGPPGAAGRWAPCGTPPTRPEFPSPKPAKEVAPSARSLYAGDSPRAIGEPHSIATPRTGNNCGRQRWGKTSGLAAGAIRRTLPPSAGGKGGLGAMGGLSALADTGAGKLPLAPLNSALTAHQAHRTLTRRGCGRMQCGIHSTRDVTRVE